MEHSTHHIDHQTGHSLAHRHVRFTSKRTGDISMACIILAITLVLLWVLIELAVVGGYALIYRVDDLMAALYLRANPISTNFAIVSLVLIAISPLIAINFYEGKK
ncbi:MAG: hypothetical protein WCV87_03735 [Candidatus Paceibacterota bacterium]|jgi:hypothetical protein